MPGYSEPHKDPIRVMNLWSASFIQCFSPKESSIPYISYINGQVHFQFLGVFYLLFLKKKFHYFFIFLLQKVKIKIRGLHQEPSDLGLHFLQKKRSNASLGLNGC